MCVLTRDRLRVGAGHSRGGVGAGSVRCCVRACACMCMCVRCVATRVWLCVCVCGCGCGCACGCAYACVAMRVRVLRVRVRMCVCACVCGCGWLAVVGAVVERPLSPHPPPVHPPTQGYPRILELCRRGIVPALGHDKVATEAEIIGALQVRPGRARCLFKLPPPPHPHPPSCSTADGVSGGRGLAVACHRVHARVCGPRMGVGVRWG